MTCILHNADGSIKSFMDHATDLPLQPGETVSVTLLPMAEYAQRFMLSYCGKTCHTVTAIVGDPEIIIDVSAPDCETVRVSINKVEQNVALDHGSGQLILSTTQPGTYMLGPADRNRFCDVGNGSLCVEINE
jgi:hypothetical protein